MDPKTAQILLGAAGSGGAAAGLYVDDVFSTYLYDGTGATQTITNGIDLSGEGGLVWIKKRDTAKDHGIFDTERGAGNRLESNTTNASDSDSVSLTAFNSNGFSLGADGNNEAVNASGEYCSWTFRKAPGFFDVVTWTGNSVNGRQIAHSLGSVPGMIVVKRTNAAENWYVYHRSLGNTSGIYLNGTSAATSGAAMWNSTTPTSTHFTLNNDYAVNGNGSTYVAYLFAHDDQSFGTGADEAIIECGTYTGNGSSSGPTVDLGFEPQWILGKSTTSGPDWFMLDNMRRWDPDGGVELLRANLNGAEIELSGSSKMFSLNSQGFQVTSTSTDFNANGTTYIYVAIRRPHKPPEAGTDVFAADADNGSEPRFTAGFPVDMGWWWERTGGAFVARVMDRFRATKTLQTRLNSAEFEQASGNHWDYMEDWYDAALGSDFFSHMFKRAPGFFDMVAYTGTGSGRTINHNLSVVPELLIVKKRSLAGSWYVTGDDLNNYADHLKIESNAAASTNAGLWNSTAPTSSVFSVGSAAGINESGQTFIAYLFASLSGISKVGTYTGTGSAINVDCGFTAGARFVLIKRTDSTGHWMCFDSVRGIVSGNDPVVRLDVNYQEITDTDYIDPLNSGFTVGTGQADLNASGGTYLFFAIA